MKCVIFSSPMSDPVLSCDNARQLKSSCAEPPPAKLSTCPRGHSDGYKGFCPAPSLIASTGRLSLDRLHRGCTHAHRHRRGNPNFRLNLFCNYFTWVSNVVVLDDWNCNCWVCGVDLLLRKIAAADMVHWKSWHRDNEPKRTFKPYVALPCAL